jgi:hypothetical protein
MTLIIPQAGYLFLVKAAVSLVLYAVIIPGLLHLLTKKLSYSSTYANLVGLRCSLIILFCGAILISLSVKLGMLIIGMYLHLPCVRDL